MPRLRFHCFLSLHQFEPLSKCLSFLSIHCSQYHPGAPTLCSGMTKMSPQRHALPNELFMEFCGFLPFQTVWLAKRVSVVFDHFLFSKMGRWLKDRAKAQEVNNAFRAWNQVLRRAPGNANICGVPVARYIAYGYVDKLSSFNNEVPTIPPQPSFVSTKDWLNYGAITQNNLNTIFISAANRCVQGILEHQDDRLRTYGLPLIRAEAEGANVVVQYFTTLGGAQQQPATCQDVINVYNQFPHNATMGGRSGSVRLFCIKQLHDRVARFCSLHPQMPCNNYPDAAMMETMRVLNITENQPNLAAHLGHRMVQLENQFVTNANNAGRFQDIAMLQNCVLRAELQTAQSFVDFVQNLH